MNFAEIHSALRDEDILTIVISKNGEKLRVSTRLNEGATATFSELPEVLDKRFTPYVSQAVDYCNSIEEAEKRLKEESDKKIASMKKSSQKPSNSVDRKQTKGEKLMGEANKLFHANQFSAAYTVFKEVLKTDYPEKSMAESKMRTCEQKMGIGGMFAEEPAPLTKEAESILSDDVCEDESCAVEEDEEEHDDGGECPTCGTIAPLHPDSGLCQNCHDNEINS